MMSKKWWVWVWSGLGLAIGHWGLSCYAFYHYKTTLCYFIRSQGWLFNFTLAIPQCLERQIPPNVSAIAWRLPMQSLLLAAVFTLLLFSQWPVHIQPGMGTILAYARAVGLTSFCVWVISSLALLLTTCYMNGERPIVNIRSTQFLTLPVKIAWLNRLQPLPSRVLDTQYALQAYVYSHAVHAVRIHHFDIAAKVPPSEVDRWRKLTCHTFPRVTTDPRMQPDEDMMTGASRLMLWPTDASWRHTSTPEFYQDDDSFLIIYRREGIVFLRRMD